MLSIPPKRRCDFSFVISLGEWLSLERNDAADNFHLPLPKFHGRGDELDGADENVRLQKVSLEVKFSVCRRFYMCHDAGSLLVDTIFYEHRVELLWMHCLSERMRQCVVNLIQGAVVKRGMTAFVVVEADPFGVLNEKTEGGRQAKFFDSFGNFQYWPIFDYIDMNFNFD
jgi:hypothetical protein